MEDESTTTADDHQDETLPESEVNESETAEETATAEQGETQESDEEDEIIVSIGDEDAPSSQDPAPAWVKELRESHRNTVKENRELREQLESLKKPKDEYIHLGEKPTLASVDYDDDRFEQELTAWYDRKRQIESKQYEQQRRQEAEQFEWQQKLNDYNSRKQKLPFKDIDEAEAIVQTYTNDTQQGLIIQGADDPALLVYALSRNTKTLQELAAIKDPVKFAFAIAKMEAKLNVKSRKAKTAPEKTISGSAPISGSVDSTLDKLRAEADRTGDYSKIARYRREKQRKARK